MNSRLAVPTGFFRIKGMYKRHSESSPNQRIIREGYMKEVATLSSLSHFSAFFQHLPQS
jgi:hypothetical protein